MKNKTVNNKNSTKNLLIKKRLIFAFFALSSFLFNAQVKTTDIVGNYMIPSKDGAIQIYENNGKYFGKIILNKDASKLDLNNPNKEMQTRKVLGLNILKDFTFDGNDTWENGSIYDPKNGKTYSCKITRNVNGDLNIRGYIGVSLLGRTEIFTKL